MAPPSFADLGKAARDVFSKGYNVGVIKVETTTVSGDSRELQFKTAANHNIASQALGGNLEVQYKLPQHGLVLKEKWTTDNVLGTTVEVNNQVARGLKLTLDSTYTPHNAKRDAVVKTEYATDQVKVNANLGLTNGPLLALSGVVGHKNTLIGVATTVDLSSNELKSSALAVDYVAPNYAIHGFTNDGQTYGASIFHRVHPNLDLGAQLGWAAGSPKTNFGIAAKYNVSRDLILRAKVDNKSLVGVSVTHALSPVTNVTLTSQFSLLGLDTSNNKIGVGLEYSI